LGNHDWIKNPFAQIEYTQVNHQWNMPAKYFVQVFQADNFSVRWIFLDTSPYSELVRSELPHIRKENITFQTEWLRQQLKRGTRYDWTFVVGHHPFYSSGNYGNFGHENMSIIENMFNEFKVDSYYSGHQHILEHLSTPQHNNRFGHQMHFFISGAGGKMSYTHIQNPNHPFSMFKIPGVGGGFMMLKLSKESAITSIINRNGDIVYKFNLNSSSNYYTG